MAAPSEWFCALLDTAPDVYFRFSLTPPRGFAYISPSVRALTGRTEVQIEGEDDARVGGSALHELTIFGARQPDRSHVNGFMTEGEQKVNGPRRNASIRQKPHGSAADGMQFVLRQRGRVCQRLSDVFLIQAVKGVRHSQPLGILEERLQSSGVAVRCGQA